jgi:hypothetical protein
MNSQTGPKTGRSITELMVDLVEHVGVIDQVRAYALDQTAAPAIRQDLLRDSLASELASNDGWHEARAWLTVFAQSVASIRQIGDAVLADPNYLAPEDLEQACDAAHRILDGLEIRLQALRDDSAN